MMEQPFYDLQDGQSQQSYKIYSNSRRYRAISWIIRVNIIIYSKRSMGNDLCGGQQENLKDTLNRERFDEEEMDDSKNPSINKVTRIGAPSISIAYNINQLPDSEKEGKNLTSIQDKISKMQAHQKKHQKPMHITRTPIEQNRLPDPYYIRSMDAIYIGEWVYDRQLNENVPGGIGRLYSSDDIIEGEIRSVNLQEVQARSTLTAMMESSNEKSKFFSALKTEKKNSKASANNLRINVILSGEGRRFTHNSEFSGTFAGGLMEGKGYCSIKEGEDIYEYTGEFKDGLKCGKGLEKFKLTSYDGDFQDDQKNGKGTLTLLINRTYENERLEEQSKLALQDKQQKEEESNNKFKAVQDFINSRQKFQDELAKTLVDFKWMCPKYGKSMTDNQNFLMEHHRKTKFLQNYKGEFKDNEFHGQGMYTWFSGKTYSGEWKEGCMEGLGEFYWPNGSLYRGHYEKDLKHGKGEMIWSLHKRFRGSWAYGVKHGYGELIEIEPKDPENKEKKCIVRVKGALFNKNEMKQVFFQERKEMNEDIEGLDLLYKAMVVSIKGIK